MERGRHPSGVRCYFVCFPVVIAGCPVGVCVVRWSSLVASLDHRLQAGIPRGCEGGGSRLGRAPSWGSVLRGARRESAST